MSSFVRSLFLICLIFHSGLVLGAPEKAEPVKSCRRQLLDWVSARWKLLAGGAVVLVGAGYGVYEATKSPAAIPQVASDPTQKADAPGSIEAWQKKHGASSPILAFNLKTEWKIEASYVEAVDSGKPTVISFAEPIWHDGKKFEELELSGALSFTRTDTAETRPYTQRDREMGEAIARHVNQSRPNELLVVHVGGSHVLDYYLRHPTKEARYATYPWNGSRKEGNVAYEEFKQLSGTPLVPDVEDSGLGLYLNKILRVADYKKAKADFNLKAAFEEKEAKGNVIFINAIPGSRDTSVIDDLPSAESLRAAGFTSVTILSEALPARAEPYSVDEVGNAADFLKSLQTQPNGLELIATLKERRPAAYDLLRSGKVQSRPDDIALVTKAHAWHQTLPVKFFAVGE